MNRLRDLRPYLVVALLNMSEGAVTMLVPPYLDSLGFGTALVGLLVSVYAVATLVVRLPAGALYQGSRGRGLLVGALLVAALTSVLYPLATATPALIGIRALHGLAYGMATTVNLALFIDAVPAGANRGRAMGYFTTALAGGFTLGQFIAGFAAQWGGYGWGFTLAAAYPLAAILLLEPARDAVRAGPTGQPKPSTALTPRVLLAALRAPGMLGVASVAFFLSFFLAIPSTFMPLYALGIGLNLAEIGLVRSAHSVCNSITRPFTGGFIEQWGFRRIAFATLLLNAVLLILLPSITTFLTLMALMTVIGFIRGIGMVANTVGVATGIDETQVGRGLASGIYYASRDVGAIIGPLVGGVVANGVGLERMFLVLPPLVFLAYAGAQTLSSRLAARRSVVPAGG